MKQLYVEPVIYLIATAILLWVYRVAGRALTEDGAEAQGVDIDKKKKVKQLSLFGAILFLVFFVIKITTIVST